MIYDWGGGLIWAVVPPKPDAQADLVRQHVNAAGGHAMLLRASETVRGQVDGPERQFDRPGRVAEPGVPVGGQQPGQPPLRHGSVRQAGQGLLKQPLAAPDVVVRPPSAFPGRQRRVSEGQGGSARQMAACVVGSFPRFRHEVRQFLGGGCRGLMIAQIQAEPG